ncbi:hypothetical protein [Streptomyces sp. YIM 98790]|uniref:hypothetical protein n=1 Tax=Streptomyces sp. YIM 98790 TaxID=2689077 RepID=UPI00140A7D5E|nr:hypothetical protein [Streptomyces sp. YIM 98790]
MSDGNTHHHYGDSVTIYGGSNNTGIVKYSSPALQEAVTELVRLLQELRGQIPPAGAQVVDDSLPVIASGASAPQERHRALIAVATIAATVGAVGQPVADAVNKVLGLLGAL